MLTKRQAELLRYCEAAYPFFVRPGASDRPAYRGLFHRRLPLVKKDASYSEQFQITPAGRAALAEFDAAQQQEQ